MTEALAHDREVDAGLEAVLSGAWAKRQKAVSQSSEAAQQLRLALSLPAVPYGGSDCRQVKRLDKLISE